LYQAIFFDAGSTIIQITPRQQRIRFALASMGFVVQPVALEDAMLQVEERLSRTFDHVYTREQEADYWCQCHRGIMEALGKTDEDDSCRRIESLGEILTHVVDDFQRKLKIDN
jgi:FMN phosphatase YigB (HAD superfamily)